MVDVAIWTFILVSVRKRESKPYFPAHLQLTLTLKMTTAEVAETSLTVNNKSPIQDYVHPDDQTQPTIEMAPGLKPFTVSQIRIRSHLYAEHNTLS